MSAAEDVRSAVRAARTAENAKAAASAAAFTAQSACDSGTAFPTIDEARAAQTRASIAQSHAFHAAVVEHEAKAVKRRATLALAHDVKCWNVHRKREMLKACIAHARSQHEATRRAVDAWSTLRDGFIGSPIIPATQTRKAPTAAHRTFGCSTGRSSVPFKADAQKASRKSAKSKNSGSTPSTSAAPINLDILSGDAFSDLLDMPNPGTASAETSTPARSSCARETSTGTDSGFSCIDPSEVGPQQSLSEQYENEATATIYQDLDSNNSGSKPVIVAVDHNILASHQEPPLSTCSAEAKSSDMFDKNDAAGIEILPFAEPVTPLMVTAAPVEEIRVVATEDEPVPATDDRNIAGTISDDNEIMSASMQSLVDGLMTWGGRFEAEDVFALPTGMAASIAFEESDGLSPQSTF